MFVFSNTVTSLNKVTHVLLTLPPTSVYSYMNESCILEGSQLSEYPSKCFSIAKWSWAIKRSMYFWVGVRTGFTCPVWWHEIIASQFEMTAASSSGFSENLDIWFIFIWKYVDSYAYMHTCMHILIGTHTYTYQWGPNLALRTCIRVLQRNRTNRRGVCVCVCNIVFNWLDEAHLHYRGQSTLFSLPIQMLTSPKNTLTETHKIMFDQLSRHLVPQSSWHIKLTITGCFCSNQ